MDLNKKASKLFLICVILFLGLSVLLGLFQGMDPNAFYLLNSLAVSIPAFLIPAIIFRRKYKLPRSGAPTAAMALLAIGIGLFITYFVGKKTLAKEIEAEERKLDL